MNSKEVFRAVWRKLREDILVVLFIVLLIVSAAYFIELVLGWFKLSDLPNVKKSLSAQRWLDTAKDSDNDGIPDVMEMTPRGKPVNVPGYGIVGTGTGTNPYNPDTDFDGFPDNAEMKIGSNPNNFWDPGFLWILWTIFFAFVIYKLFIEKPDRLREYQLNEDIITGGGVAGKKGKFAYGGASNPFEKSVSAMTAEEKKQLIESDPRFADLKVGEMTHKKRKFPVWAKTLVQFLIITVIVLGGFLIFRH